jgi:hypothetical protein
VAFGLGQIQNRSERLLEELVFVPRDTTFQSPGAGSVMSLVAYSCKPPSPIVASP